MSFDAVSAVGCVPACVAVGIGTLALCPGGLLAAVVAFEEGGSGVALVEGRCAVSVGVEISLCSVFCSWGREMFDGGGDGQKRTVAPWCKQPRLFYVMREECEE